ncbi:tRNA (guanine(46)-N(7))-methyltransferase TrmB [Rhodobacteraceae bacterium DSL-40]|uniref:tRNA (guanine(46)-N(7))-methyltransferase TrmB n=1 Tax=Amaricoccus sp. B4 TaxID=3368557 RepID=UPI000DAF309F
MTDHDPIHGADPAPHRRKLYGRRKGKALRATQERLMAELLPEIWVPGFAGGEAPAPLDPAALFGGPRPLWLEIGFGGGEHLAHQAALHPETRFIGCEPFVNGVAMLLGRIEAAGLSNVRVHPADARDLIERLPEGSVGRVFLLYPDPWPKARHHRRRFMNPDNLAMLARVMPSGAELRVASDIPDYVEHALAAVAACGALFETVEPEAPDWSVAWSDWPGTRYEAKALKAGRTPHYLTFRRL